MQHPHPLALLNTSIITTDGTYQRRTISLEEARTLVAQASALDSAIGHASTAQAMTELLGISVPVNRQQLAQAPGQQALVFQLNGRPPEGAVLGREDLEEIGYTWRLLTRTA